MLEIVVKKNGKMVLELGTELCACEDVRLPRGWIVRSHIDWIGEQNIIYKGVETSL